MAGKRNTIAIQETAEAIAHYEKIVEQAQNKASNLEEKKENTRSTIAIFFVRWYFILIGLVFISSLLYNFVLMNWIPDSRDQLLNPKDLILVISSTVGASLGFIVGYYFKGLEEKNK